MKKILQIYDLGNIVSKPIVRKGFKLTKKNTNKPTNKSKVKIVPDWGGEQTLQVGNHILLTLDGKKHYGIEKKAFKKHTKNYNMLVLEQNWGSRIRGRADRKYSLIFTFKSKYFILI